MANLPEVPQAPTDPTDLAAQEAFMTQAQAYVEAVNEAVQEQLGDAGYSDAMSKNLAERMGITLPVGEKSEPYDSPHVHMVKAASKKKAKKRVRTAI